MGGLNVKPVRWFQTGTMGWRADLLGFVFFSIVLVTQLVLHPFWRDEAHAWLIVEAARSPLDLFAVLSEAHPPLWYWILEFVQLFSSSMYSMKVVTGLFGVATLAVLWTRSGLATIDKILISAGYYTSWQYGVFSRDYLPGMFFLLVFSCFWLNWRRHPIAGAVLLGLACLTHALFVPVAGIVALLFVYDWWRDKPDRRIFIFCVVFLVFVVVTCVSLAISLPEMKVVIKEAAPATETKQLFSRIGYAFTANVIGEPFETIAGIAFFVAFLPLVPVIILVAVGGLFLSGFQVFIYGGMSWHVGTIYVLLVSVYVVYHRQIYRWVPRALMVFSAVGGVLVPLTMTRPYATGEQAAALIRQAGLENANWAAFPDYGGEVAFAILRRPFYSINCDCQLTYVKWRQRIEAMDETTFDRRLRTFMDKASFGEPSYMLLGRTRAEAVMQFLQSHYSVRVIGQTPPAVWNDESFYLVRINF